MTRGFLAQGLLVLQGYIPCLARGGLEGANFVQGNCHLRLAFGHGSRPTGLSRRKISTVAGRGSPPRNLGFSVFLCRRKHSNRGPGTRHAHTHRNARRNARAHRRSPTRSHSPTRPPVPARTPAAPPFTLYSTIIALYRNVICIIQGITHRLACIMTCTNPCLMPDLLYGY